MLVEAEVIPIQSFKKKYIGGLRFPGLNDIAGIVAPGIAFVPNTVWSKINTRIQVCGRPGVVVVVPHLKVTTGEFQVSAVIEYAFI